MQNKSAIWVFTILLVLACLYEMSFSFFTGETEKDAKIAAQEKVDSLDSEGLTFTISEKDSILQAFESDYINAHSNDEVVPLLGTKYKHAKQKEINLGLDLQGGMHVTLEVSVPDLVKALGSNSQNPTFQKRLSSLKIEWSRLQTTT